MKEYKRQYRELEDATKQKISQSSKNKPKCEIFFMLTPCNYHLDPLFS